MSISECVCVHSFSLWSIFIHSFYWKVLSRQEETDVEADDSSKSLGDKVWGVFLTSYKVKVLR